MHVFKNTGRAPVSYCTCYHSKMERQSHLSLEQLGKCHPPPPLVFCSKACASSRRATAGGHFISRDSTSHRGSREDCAELQSHPVQWDERETTRLQHRSRRCSESVSAMHTKVSTEKLQTVARKQGLPRDHARLHVSLGSCILTIKSRLASLPAKALFLQNMSTM